ncbi:MULTISPECIES: SnoaL-like domain-containing protein [unclassified Lysobacter]|uniref:SnoaL-like domain-containing protein n=1 Tax=unclassified Lysobacter TaxID=2635362 RepID=UPI001C235DA9|nr:SnoaL-like domain-containing protein [Lysobacter sp. MMG2]MBU8976911.1 nuclear transport factor 2 family protein [Lysobacter sp. MMG2]
MDIQQVANRLVELCRAGQYDQAQEELYADGAVSIEGDGQKAESIAHGMAAIREKGKQWADNLVEIHGGSVSDPVIADGWFSVAMGLDATYRDMGRVAMKEIAVYQVRDGKITHEQFFYNADKG